MRSLLLCIVALAGAATTVRAHDASAATAAAVRAADIAFEKHAQDVGAARAFRDFMDQTDGLEFNGGPPVRGAEAIYRAMGGDTPSKTKLQWTPTEAWGSTGGDMGVTAGTWKLTAGGNTTPVIAGHYVTVWRKNAAGQWKGLIDIGNPDAD